MVSRRERLACNGAFESAFGVSRAHIVGSMTLLIESLTEEERRVWLAGRLGESMPMSDPDPSTLFNVRAVHERVEGDGAHAAQFIRGDACLAIRSLKRADRMAPPRSPCA